MTEEKFEDFWAGLAEQARLFAEKGRRAQQEINEIINKAAKPQPEPVVSEWQENWTGPSPHYVIVRDGTVPEVDEDYPTVVGPFVSEEAADDWVHARLPRNTWEYVRAVRKPW